MYKILFFNFNPNSVNDMHVGFEEVGCIVYNYFIKEPITTQRAPLDDYNLEKDLTSIIETFKPDIVFSYGWWINRLNLNLFCSILKRRGIFHVYWAYDDPECFEKISYPIGKQCDLVFTTVVECIPLYKSHNIDAKFLFHSCNPNKHKKTKSLSQFQNDIVLLANNYNVIWDINYFNYRFNGIKNVLHPLILNNYDVAVYGLWWDSQDRIYKLPPKNIRPFICDYESKIYSSCKIGLGLQSVGNSISHISVRTLEVLACNTFHLTQYSPALEYYFKKGMHLEWSSSPKETLEITSFYLKNNSAREKIALEGQREVYSKHTLKHRALEAINVLKKYVRAK